jgi:hypothetical protein
MSTVDYLGEQSQLGHWVPLRDLCDAAQRLSGQQDAHNARKSSILFLRMIGSMFMRVNSKYAHHRTLTGDRSAVGRPFATSEE